MRKLISVLATTAALGGGVAAIPAPALAKTCHGDYVHAVIGGHQKCLGAGEYCAPRYNRAYHRHGFNCVRYPSGDHRLKHRRR